jgi:CRISPR-associated protein Csd1
MILQRLYELAEREGLLEDTAFKPAQVACVINIGPHGEYLGIQDLRRKEGVTSGKKGSGGKARLDRGRGFAVPVRPVVPAGEDGSWKTTDPAAIGKDRPAAFLADALPRVLPIDRLLKPEERPKSLSQRSTFWRFVELASQQTNDAALTAMCQFARRMADSQDIAEQLTREIEAKAFGLGDICTFALQTDQGSLILERPEVRNWWRDFFRRDRAAMKSDQRKGFCQVTHKSAPIAASIKAQVRGLMGIGCLANAYIVSPILASESLGLDAVECAMISDDGIDGYTRAMNALIANSLKDRPRTSLKVGNCMFLFWTRQAASGFDPATLLEQPDVQLVEQLVRSVHTGKPSLAVAQGDFYCLALSGNAARIVVRSYLETTIPHVQASLARWFGDLQIINAGNGEIACAFSLIMLAGATVRDLRDLSPHVAPQLLSAAIQGLPLSDSILSACLRRLAVEGGEGFRAARMALIRLVLNRTHTKEQLMNERLDANCKSPAYVCGRMLAAFERIQWAALGDVNATVVDRFYGTASTAPSLVFPRLFKMAEQHLSKVHGERPGQAVNLQKDLESLSIHLTGFPCLLSLAQQGQFALGFYHQRAEYRNRRKADEETAAVSPTAAQT